ncbi:Uncharacterised protein [Salmonella enterica]|nr:Uncharacterised protein [Salmonella enterica]SUG11435.1 Uncharacterised protein [Salmonella enterica subsp. enterica serovar Dublin]SUI08833.1 Uncharacterised protein [Salmonella enterica subsp. enterica serovar Dublin]
MNMFLLAQEMDIAQNRQEVQLGIMLINQDL